MTRRRVRSYEMLQRLARVRESRASLELAEAVRGEKTAAKNAADAMSSRVAATAARQRCLEEQSGLAIGEYSLLTALCESLHEREMSANAAWQQAKNHLTSKSEAVVIARRFADGAEERWIDSRRAVATAVDGRALADSLDLWVSSKEGT